MPFYLDRCDRHYKNQKWTRQDFGGKLPSEVFKEHSLVCFITDPSALKLRHEMGIDTIAFEADYPHSDCLWPDAPETLLAELEAAGATTPRSTQIGWQNAARFLGWDPFAHVTRGTSDGRPAARPGHRCRHQRGVTPGVAGPVRGQGGGRGALSDRASPPGRPGGPYEAPPGAAAGRAAGRPVPPAG